MIFFWTRFRCWKESTSWLQDIAWYVYQMVAQNTLCSCEGTMFRNNFNRMTAVDVNKSLKQVKLHVSLHTCAYLSELPSLYKNYGAAGPKYPVWMRDVNAIMFVYWHREGALPPRDSSAIKVHGTEFVFPTHKHWNRTHLSLGSVAAN